MVTQHTPILKRVGTVLVVVGLIDIAAMIYCIANGISYSSSFNIFAVVAGILLLRGSLRAASIVRWFAVFFMALLIWLVSELGLEPIMAARASAGRKKRDMRIPAAVGAGLVIVMGAFMALLLGRESASRAKSMAEQRVGSGYRFHVSSLNIAKNDQGTFVSGLVTAWNDSEIRDIPVHWEER